MPILNVRISGEPDARKTTEIANFLLDKTVDILHKRRDLTAVAIDYVSPEQWFVGGRTLAEQGKASFYFDIKIVDGTNTKDEKARYQREVFEGMRERLGDLHEESYIYVQEVKGDAYGFGGLTQEYRYIAAKVEAEARIAAPA
jgi:4-oxalocrotonate tautomerase